MNYYPNNNVGYAGYNSYVQPNYPPYMNTNYMPQQQTMPQQSIMNNTSQQIQPQTQQSQNNAVLPGKIVESRDIVGVTEIQPNSWSIFPKCDFSEIYLKTWKDGQSPQIIKYAVVNDSVETTPETNNQTNEILQNIQVLSNGISNVNDVIANFGNNFNVIDNKISALESKISLLTDSLGG